MIAYTTYATDPRVRREAEALVGRGDSVDFICEEGDVTQARQEYNGVRLYPLSVGRYRGDSNLVYLTKYFSFFIKSFALVTWLFFKKRYDIVQVHTMPDFLVFAAIVPKLFGAKIVLDVHDLMPELYCCKFGPGKKTFIIRLITWVERASIAFAHKAIAVHIPHRDALIGHGNAARKFEVLLNVPDSSIFIPNGDVRKDDTFRLIYHGTVARRHGLEVALKAMRSVKEEIPRVEFLIIGSGDDLDRVKKLAETMELQDCVRFEKPVPVEKLPQYLTQADVGLVPILYDPFTRYMLPLKLLEYVRMGIPAIVSETETIRAYFDDQMVRFTTPGDERELATAIVELYQSPEKRNLLRSNAQRFNAKYNWIEQKEVYFKTLDSLLQTSVASKTAVN